MSKDGKLKGSGTNCKLVFVSIDNPVKNISRKIKKEKQTKPKKFDIFFCLFFEHYCQTFTSAEETGLGAVSPCSFRIFPKCPYFLRC